ncbi:MULTISPECIES: FxsA family protein [Saliphagus]|uniref:FxsA family protein n=1 Tax=Saliphagus infecundisoli TaxID=1849069 RepID=A0ABD5QBU6_9EURY|nr:MULTISPECIES: FxsA family protein [Saliphagus]
MLRWILALLLIPFLDAVVLAVVVSQTTYVGWVGMVLLVVLTGLVGMILVRAEGRRTIRKIQRSLAEGQPPTNELLDGALLIAAGAFLLTPGLVTDLIGFLLVVPITRVPIRMGVKRYVVTPYLDEKTGGFTSGAVWTYGFPGGGGTDAGGQAGRTGTGPGPDADDGGDTVDLGDDDYSVEGESYTVDVEDPSDGDPTDDGADAR